MHESQRLLPISNSRFGWWLFLSADMMMFAGVVGASFILRSGVPRNEWPDPSWVKSHWCIGMVTIVLLLSICWFLWKEQRSRTEATKQTTDPIHRFPWTVVATLFAVFATSVIGLDYQNKISLGLFPNRNRPMVYSTPDFNYLSNVSTAANNAIASLEQESKTDSVTQKQLEQWKLIRGGLIDWTRTKVGRSGDPTMQKLSLAQLADQIYRTRPDSRLAKFAQDETAEVKSEMETASSNLQALGTDDTVASQPLRQSVNQLEQRLRYLDTLTDEKLSVLDDAKKILPKVIPGGPTWIADYWLLTGFLFVHMLIGTCLLAFVLANRHHASATESDTLQNVTAFWYFVATTGIIISLFVWVV